LADEVDGQLVCDLVDRARADGVKLTGEGGLLSRLTKIVLESAVDGEMVGWPEGISPSGSHGVN